MLGVSWENQQIAYAKIKAQISTFVFATRIVQSLYFLKTKFHDSILFSVAVPVCAESGQKPQRWFSHEATHVKIGEPSGRRSFHIKDVGRRR